MLFLPICVSAMCIMLLYSVKSSLNELCFLFDAWDWNLFIKLSASAFQKGNVLSWFHCRDNLTTDWSE